MEARRCMEFTGVELASDAELTALVEKATVGPVKKAVADPCAREARGVQEVRWRGRKKGCCVLAQRRCWPRSGGAMKREARWRGKPGEVFHHRGGAWSAIAESCCDVTVR
jgi:hypothetical protein